MLVNHVSHLDLVLRHPFKLRRRPQFAEPGAGPLFRDVQDFLLQPVQKPRQEPEFPRPKSGSGACVLHRNLLNRNSEILDRLV